MNKSPTRRSHTPLHKGQACVRWTRTCPRGQTGSKHSTNTKIAPLPPKPGCRRVRRGIQTSASAQRTRVSPCRKRHAHTRAYPPPRPPCTRALARRCPQTTARGQPTPNAPAAALAMVTLEAVADGCAPALAGDAAPAEPGTPPAPPSPPSSSLASSASAMSLADGSSPTPRAVSSTAGAADRDRPALQRGGARGEKGRDRPVTKRVCRQAGQRE
jgi:hypothetical protein